MIFDEKNPSLSIFPVFLKRKKQGKNEKDGYFRQKSLAWVVFLSFLGLARAAGPEKTQKNSQANDFWRKKSVSLVFPCFSYKEKTRENDIDGFFSPKIISLKNFFS